MNGDHNYQPGDRVIVEARFNDGRYIGREATFIEKYDTKNRAPGKHFKARVRLLEHTPMWEAPDGVLYLEFSEIRPK